MKTRLALFLAVLTGGFSFVVQANDGVLDPTCGAGGKVTIDVFGSQSNQLNGAAVQGDGKIVVAGAVFAASNDFALARYNVDGSLDSSFGSGGVVTTDFSGDLDQALAIAIQSNGKIVAVGFARGSTTRRDFAVARYNADGSLDTSFGTGGKVTTDFISNSVDSASALVIQGDGKILAAGTSNNQFALARYNTDGSLDASFGTGGRVTTAIMGLDDEALAVAIQPGGKIVAAGFTLIGGLNSEFALARYDPTDGSLDPTFGTGGIEITDFAGGLDEITALKIQSDGRIIAGGVSLSGTSNYDFALARYNAGNGDLDSSFGTGGRVTTDFSGGDDQIDSLILQSDGKLLAAGSASNGDMALARYNADGSLDSSFGGGGKVTTDFSGGADSAHTVLILSNGQVLAAGTATVVATGRDFALARYSSAGILDLTFGTAGKVTTDMTGSTPNDVHALAIQADGRIVMAGSTPRAGNDFAVARVLANGSLDSSFGAGGIILTDFLGGGDSANAVLVQPDGKIVAGGTACCFSPGFFNFVLARYDTDGSLDATFGSGGKVHTAIQGYDDEATAIAIQADNKIVAAGYSGDTANVSLFALARYNPDGSLDATFGSGGTVTTSVLGVYNLGYSVAIQADQRIVVSGVATDSSTYAPKFALARYNTDGTLDSGFGTGGLVTTSFFGVDDESFSVAIQADQKIVAAGYASDDTGAKFAIARYNTDGTLDSSFGTGGLVTRIIFGNDDEALSVAVQRDQKIVLTGFALSSIKMFALARFNTDGTIDANFGTGGSVTTSFGGADDEAHASAIQPDGKILAAGLAVGETTGTDFALARYFVCDFLDVPPGNIYRPSICSVAQANITAGCGNGDYCPDRSVTRAEMAVLLLKAEHGYDYAPPACTGIFADVTCTPSVGFPDWIEQLATENITGGCFTDPLRYCPDREVRRDEMAAFLLKTEHGAGYDPPDCAGIFEDVPCTPGVGFSDWIERLAGENVTGGCFTDPLRYCPDRINSRGEMAVFLVKTFTLPL